MSIFYRKELKVRVLKPFAGWGDGTALTVDAVPEGHHILDLRYDVETSDSSASSDLQVQKTNPTGNDSWDYQVRYELIVYSTPPTTDWFDVTAYLLVVDQSSLPTE